MFKITNQRHYNPHHGKKDTEAVKLFAITYLVLRISFFNELDTYAEIKDLDPQATIQGIDLDPRMGTHYNNPSFDHGIYCLQKDIKQILQYGELNVV